jgi:hypothetical protein
MSLLLCLFEMSWSDLYLMRFFEYICMFLETSLTKMLLLTYFIGNHNCPGLTYRPKSKNHFIKAINIIKPIKYK